MVSAFPHQTSKAKKLTFGGTQLVSGRLSFAVGNQRVEFWMDSGTKLYICVVLPFLFFLFVSKGPWVKGILSCPEGGGSWNPLFFRHFNG